MQEFEPGRSIADVRKSSSAAANHAAALLYSILSDFPRSLPFFSQMTDPLNAATRARSSAHPMLNTLFSTLWMYPYAGTYVDISGVRMRSALVLDERMATLTITLMAPGDDRRKSGFDSSLVS